MVVLTEATMRQDIYKILFDLINGSKPSGWTVTAVLPEDPPQLPQIVIFPTIVKEAILTANAAMTEYEFEVSVLFVGKDVPGTFKKSNVDAAKDTVVNLVRTNRSTLKTSSNILYFGFEDDTNDVDFLAGQKVHTASVTFRFKARAL